MQRQKAIVTRALQQRWDVVVTIVVNETRDLLRRVVVVVVCKVGVRVRKMRKKSARLWNGLRRIHDCVGIHESLTMTCFGAETVSLDGQDERDDGQVVNIVAHSLSLNDIDEVVALLKIKCVC